MHSVSNNRSRWRFSRRARLIFVPIFVLACVSFITFILISFYLGGDAFNGFAQNGHYVLSNHGKYTDVSRAVWIYSYLHSIVMLVTFGLGLALFTIFRITGDISRNRSH